MQFLDETLASFLPIDRRHALRAGHDLPELADGSVLLADISGFTFLTSRLVDTHGPARGAETLAAALTAIFDALISAVHAYHGSVLSIAGDAITCWFDGDTGLRATTCACRIQEAMRAIGTVSVSASETVRVWVKVAVAAGRVRRMVVGNPDIQLIDVIAGEPIDHLATAGQLARAGEIVLCGRTTANLADAAEIREWRAANSGERMAVLSSLKSAAGVAPWPPGPWAVQRSESGNWILPVVYERFRARDESLSAEFRTTAAMFLRFSGLNFDSDLHRLLDRYLRWVQSRVDHYGGTLMQLSTGDKGSYLYAFFGALERHKDDLDRALLTALELRRTPADLAYIEPPQIGVCIGRAYVGSLGCPARQTFGGLGAEINMAARLMEVARPGQVIVSREVARLASARFQIADLGLSSVKGVSEPSPVFELLRRRPRSSEVTFSEALVGRDTERQLLADALHALVSARRSSAIVIEGVAGIGKTSLLGELHRRALEAGVPVLLSAGDAVERLTPYHAFRSTVLDVLGVHDSEAQVRAQSVVQRALARLGETERAPLLNIVVGTSFAETALTRTMTGKTRGDNTIDLVVRLIEQECADTPVVLLLEDAHWMDSASAALVDALWQRLPARLLVAATRPPDGDGQVGLVSRSEAMATASRMVIGPLPPAASLALAMTRLGVERIPPAVADVLLNRAEGHPFFVEELLYALRDTGLLTIVDRECRLAPNIDSALLELPATIEGVILSRIDLLSPSQQLVLRVASVIGRSFGFDVLHGIYPVEADRGDLPGHLSRLHALDITPLVGTDPVVTHMFKHVITRDVSYGSLLFSQRRRIHQAIAEWHEHSGRDDLRSQYPILAHHWREAGDRERAVRYLALAGGQALEGDANEEALRFLAEATRLADGAPLLGEGSGQVIAVDSLERATWEYQMGEANYRLGDLRAGLEHLAQALRWLGTPLPASHGRMTLQLVVQIGKQAVLRLRRRGRRTADRRSTDRAVELGVKIHGRMLELSFMSNDNLGTAYGTMHSLNLAEKLGPTGELADAYSKVCVASGLVGLQPVARTYRRLALGCLERLGESGDPIAAANVLMSLSLHTLAVADWESSDQYLVSARQTWSRYRSRDRAAICDELLRLSHLYQGRIREHGEIAREILSAARERRDDLYTSIGLSALMLQEIMTADDPAAGVLALADEAEALGAKLTSIERTKTRLFRAVALAVAGRHDEARPLATEAAGDLASLAPTVGLLPAYLFNAELGFVLRPGAGAGPAGESAKRAVASCRPLIRYARLFAIGRPRQLVYQGRIKQLQGRADEGQRLMATGLQRACELRLPIEIAIAHLELGRHLPATRPERRAHLEQAIEQFDRMGIALYRRQAEQALGAASS
jgi:class 3 adenylate cyclase